MSEELYACIHVAEFPAQTLLRLHPELRAQPVAVLEGIAPLQTVCSMNTRARRAGAVQHMTRVEAEAIPSLRLLPRSMECEVSARVVMLERAMNFSPRIEDVSTEAVCACVLDIACMERLFGSPEMIAQHIRAASKTAGFHATVAISANFHTARIMAAFTRGIVLIPAGDEAEVLSALPIHALNLPDDHAETFALWGIRTLGGLAALDESALVSRLGHEARAWRELSLGIHSHTFQPIEQQFDLTEFCEFEEPVEQVESLLFVCTRMIDCLVERATSRAMSLAVLKADLKLEGGKTHRCTIRPALPSVDRKFLLKLLQLEFAAHPPQHGVITLTLSAEAGQSSKVQLGLFSPQTPEPSRLDVTIARLKAIVGEDRVGSPMLEDTHRAESFRMEGFTVAYKPSGQRNDHPRLALRRIRPPVSLRVMQRDMRPAQFQDQNASYVVHAAYGPWRSSGCWWSINGWNTEEWDVLAVKGGVSLACLLVHDRTRNVWQLEAFYD
jgi:protein ImuB